MKNVQCLLAVCVALFCSILVYGQTEQEIEEKYGKPLKAYMVSNSIYMLPQYNSGQLYSVTLYCSRIKIHHGDSFPSLHGNCKLPWSELKTVLDTLTPKSERGVLKSVYEENIYGQISTTYEYENVSIYFLSFSSDGETKVSRLNTDPQVTESQSALANKPSPSGALPKTVEDISARTGHAAEFVQIIWLNRKQARK